MVLSFLVFLSFSLRLCLIVKKNIEETFKINKDKHCYSDISGLSLPENIQNVLVFFWFKFVIVFQLEIIIQRVIKDEIIAFNMMLTACACIISFLIDSKLCNLLQFAKAS